MNYSRAISTFLFALPFLVISQQAQDILYLKNGEVDTVKILNISEEEINYEFPKEGIPISISTDKLNKIKTRTGREIKFENSSKTKTVFTVLDWEKVEITGIEREVHGLDRVANVSGKAKGLTVYSSLEKMQTRAMDKMKMQAAFMGCDLVYLLHQRNEDVRYGSGNQSNQPASSSVSGTAYSMKPVSSENVQKGRYALTNVYYISPNMMNFRERPLEYYNNHLIIDDQSFSKGEDYYQVQFNPGIEDSGNVMYLIKANDRQVVFLVIDKNRQGKTKYYNLFYELQ
jgi:hypothetical protein